MSELEIKCGSKNLMVFFGGMPMCGNVKFEFLNYLGPLYKETCDLIFYVDQNMCCYHLGIEGITTNIDETVEYLNEKIKNYQKVIFMGISAGGYASILFGSLCNNVTDVVSFIPPTMLKHEKYKVYRNLKGVINNSTRYYLYADLNVKEPYNCHHVSHCENIEGSNVKIIRKDVLDIKHMRDSGELKQIIDKLL
jgi:hypothetical protein